MTTVRYILDPKNPPQTKKKDLEQFDAINDEDIDYTDIPEMTASFWATAEIEKPNQKTPISMRIDEKTLEFFKGQYPRGYSSRMAAILKAYAKSQQPKQN